MVHQLLLSSPCCFSLKTQLHSHGYAPLSSHCSIITPNFTFSKLYKNWLPLVSSLIPLLSRQSSDYFQQSSSKFSSSYSPTSTPGVPPRVFVGHSIYKGKAALTVEPRAPEFVPLDSGAFKISKEGFILLQFAPAAGVRQYDWSRKQVFSLSVLEIGSLVSLGARESCEFFHDPNKGKRQRKVLKVEPLPDGTGYFFNLGVQNKLLNLDESIYIPNSKAEFAFLSSAFNFMLPYLLGWNVFADSIKPDDSNRANSSNTRTVDYEWSR